MGFQIGNRLLCGQTVRLTELPLNGFTEVTLPYLVLPVTSTLGCRSTLPVSVQCFEKDVFPCGVHRFNVSLDDVFPGNACSTSDFFSSGTQ